MASIWQKETVIPRRESLQTNIKTDVAILGGGMTGILTADFLNRQGIRCVVLEARRIGCGQSGRTTAKVTSQHGLIYDSLRRHFGLKKAKMYADANQEAIMWYRSRIQRDGIDCAWEEQPAYLYTQNDPARLKQELKTAQALGLPAEWAKADHLPFSTTGSIRFSGQGQFQPLAFLKAVSQPLTVYENTPVIGFRGHRVITPHGIVFADKIVVATHFPIRNFPGLYFSRMHQQRSYVLALKNAENVEGMYIGAEQNSLSFRNYGEFLLLGGEGRRTGKQSEKNPFQVLEQTARSFYPSCEIAARWAAQDCMTLDQAPYIGTFSPSMPQVLVAAGFNKWGMTSSAVAAQLVSDKIMGRTNPFAPAFSPRRSIFHGGAGALVKNGVFFLRDWWKERMERPVLGEEEIQPGCGGIVEHQGHKVGLYRDESGKEWLVSPRCPHLGCQLVWNAAEKTWDCPCHGSRFDFRGKRIDAPAQKNITLE